MKLDGTKMEILPALQAAEQQGIFKRPAPNPYYLKKAAYNPDRPHENNEWGFCPPEKPKGNAGAYKLLQRQAKDLGINSFGMKGPELEVAVKEAMSVPEDIADEPEVSTETMVGQE